jgi:hypothetical protein
MADRVHVFAGGAGLLRSRHIIRVMARCLTGDADCRTEESLAATYDDVLGGNDAAVGAHMTMLINGSSDPREHAERVVMACDLLRQARRSKHRAKIARSTRVDQTPPR